MSKFKVGDLVATIYNSHYIHEPQTVTWSGPDFVHLEGLTHHAGTGFGLIEFYDDELEHWDIYGSPLCEALK